MDKIDHRQEQMYNISTKLEVIVKNQKEMLDIKQTHTKNTVTDLKNNFHKEIRGKKKSIPGLWNNYKRHNICIMYNWNTKRRTKRERKRKPI